jgi:hypothetical protein
MAAPFTCHGRRRAAKRRLVASSVAPVAFGYERGRPRGGRAGSASSPGFPAGIQVFEARFSRPATVTCSKGDC